MKIEAIVCIVMVVLVSALAAELGVSCPVPVPPVNGHIRYIHGGLFLQYTCDPGYRLIGSTYSSCSRTKWQPDPPTCELRKDYNSAIKQKRSCARNMGGCSQRCVQSKNEVTCGCHSGYSLDSDGRTCVDINECLDRNYECAHKCTNVRGRAYCSCHVGYKLQSDGKSCVDINECLDGNFGCSHKCINVRGKAHCSCPTGYKLYKDSKTCIDIDECSKKQWNYCQQTCINSQGSFSCSCWPGYVLVDANSCKASVAETTAHCPVPASPLHGQAHLYNSDQNAWYECNPGYYLVGNIYASCVDSKWQPEPPVCVLERGCGRDSYLLWNGAEETCEGCPPNSYTEGEGKTSIADCLCLPGFVGDPGRNVPCTGCSADTYLVRNGGQATCERCPPNSHTNGVGKTSIVDCLCLPGFRGDPGRNVPCRDIDECSSERLNQCQQKCINSPGSYTCSCLPGYVQEDKYRCKGCGENSYLVLNGGEVRCEECPPNSYTDGVAKTSVDDCLCIPGFLGDPGRNVPCTDINECEENNYNCSHECINTPGSAFCSCPKGYETDTDSKTCIDTDECSVKNGGCEGQCHNFEGGFNCSCLDGYRKADFYTCADIDECADNNGHCDQKCVNYAGGHYCSCNDGYKLNSDQKSCSIITCPRIPQSRNGKIICHKEGGNRYAKKKDALPIKTKCYLECKEGYTRSSEINVTCEQNGKWSGALPQCKALQCPPLEIPENGDIYPPSCKNKPVDVLKKCYITCPERYRLSGPISFRCLKNRTWTPSVVSACMPIKNRPYIVCPADITAKVPVGRDSAQVTVPRPETNVDEVNLRWTPEWIELDQVMSFPAGVTEILFQTTSAVVPQVSCTLRVNILDEEPPKIVFCPESFDVRAKETLGTAVSWEEPVFTDNVNVTNVAENLVPNSTLSPGVHIVKYTAYDNAGNSAECEFIINVTTAQCGYPVGPSNGDANCNDWLLGRVCEATCNPGYVLYPQEPYLFMCDDAGIWQPSNRIQDCAPFTAAENSNCTEGFELQVDIYTGTEICVECPPNLVWSEVSRMCTEGNVSDDYNSNFYTYNETKI